MSDERRFTVPLALAGERVDRALALLTGWSRAEVVTLLEAGSVTVGGRAVAKSRRLAEGEEVAVADEPAPVAPPAAEPVDFTVVHADDDVVVVSKPAGLVVHPGAGHDRGTLVHGLLARFPELATVGDPMRPGIVHRLDRDTSGLMVVARSPRAHAALTAALAGRTAGRGAGVPRSGGARGDSPGRGGEAAGDPVERVYLALAWGRFDARRGTIDAPIGRSDRRRTRMAIREAGREARTGYEVQRQYQDPVCALVECRLETGRTHQIRVHLTAIGHPVVGDAAYGGDRPGLRPGRPFLHATTLAFTHPGSGERLRFSDPLPSELAAVLSDLDARPGAP